MKHSDEQTTEIPESLREILDELDAETLDRVATVAQELAESKQESHQPSHSDSRNGNRDGNRDDDSSTEKVEPDTPETAEREERPDSVPGKATTVIKEINDNRYYYWQWRDGDKVKSKYMKPVDSTLSR